MSDSSDTIETADRYGTPAERATLLISVASASVAFMLAFNLGAYGEIFFDQIFTVWVTSTIVFVGSIFSRLPPNSWPARLVLLIPSAWLLVAWIDNPRKEDAGESALAMAHSDHHRGSVAVRRLDARLDDQSRLPRPPPIEQARPWRSPLWSSSPPGYLIGARNDVLLTCDDFKVSGNDLPANCVKIDPSS